MTRRWPSAALAAAMRSSSTSARQAEIALGQRLPFANVLALVAGEHVDVHGILLPDARGSHGGPASAGTLRSVSTRATSDAGSRHPVA